MASVERRKKQQKEVIEMLGEFFRDAAVLVTVFFPLEFALRDKDQVSIGFLIIVCCLSMLLLILGITCEKMRG